MDCLFNKNIPQGTEKKIILRPSGKTFVNGLASNYEVSYDDKLKPYIDKKEFEYTIEKLNNLLYMMWPCCYCLSFGYLCALCTFGLSFCFPYLCISEAKSKFDQELVNVNSKLYPKHLQISFKSKCSTSWLEIDILDNINDEKVYLTSKHENNNGLIKVQEENKFNI